LFITLVWGGAEIWTRWKAGRTVLEMGAVAMLTACLILTNRQLQYWKNSLTLFEHASAVTSKNFLAYTI